MLVLEHEHIDLEHFNHTVAETRRVLQRELAQCNNPVVTTKFNPRSGVLLHLLSTMAPQTPVVWVDTGYNTRDTLAFANYLEALLNLNLKVYRPVDHQIIMPPALNTPDHKAFTQSVKLEPFQRALNELQPDVWFSSLRSSQNEFRSTLPEREFVTPELVKVAPLLSWSDAYMDYYLALHRIAKGPECVDPTKGDEKRECGLHTQRWNANDSVAAA